MGSLRSREGQSPTLDHQSRAGAEQASSPLSSHRGPGQEWPLGEALLAPPTASLSEASPAITAGFRKVGTSLMTSEGLRMKNSDEKAFKRQALEELEETKEFHLEPQSSSSVPSCA